HEKYQGAFARNGGQRGSFAVQRMMTGEEGDAAGEVAVGDGDAGVCGDGVAGGNAGDDFEGNGGGGEGEGLFSAASEDEGIAAFEPDDGVAAAGFVDEEAVDVVLF